MKTINKILLPTATIALVILLWFVVHAINIFPKALLPSPIEVLFSLVELFFEGTLLMHTFASIYRVMIGFLIAMIVGIPLGLIIGTYKTINTSINPLIQIIRHISPIAWIPLAILWFGVGDSPAIFIIFITAIFPMMIASYSAVRRIDPTIMKVAKNFGAKGKQLLSKVILPATFPQILTGIRISLGISWVIIVAAEMVGMSSGLGYLILDARNFLRIDLVIGGMIVIGLIGLLIDFGLNEIETRVKRRWIFGEGS